MGEVPNIKAGRTGRDPINVEGSEVSGGQPGKVRVSRGEVGGSQAVRQGEDPLPGHGAGESPGSVEGI